MNISTLKRNILFVLIITAGCCSYTQMEAKKFEKVKAILIQASTLAKTFKLNTDKNAMRKKLKEIVPVITTWLSKISESSELNPSIVNKLEKIHESIKVLLKSLEKKGANKIRILIDKAKPDLEKQFNELIVLLKKEDNSEELVKFFEEQIAEAIKPFRSKKSVKTGIFSAVKNAVKKAAAVTGIGQDEEVALAHALSMGIL